MARPPIKRNAVLEFIRSKGPDGARFTDIQRFVVEMNGYNYDEKQPEDIWNGPNMPVTTVMRKRFRGYWCVNLYGTNHFSSRGILPTYCEQLPNRRYVLKEGV